MNFKRLTTALLTGTALAAAAATPRQIAVEPGAYHPVLSPDGTTLLYSGADHTGLKALNLADGTVTVIDRGVSAGFMPVFSADSRRVYYRTATTVDGLLYRDVRMYEAGGTSSVVSQPSRRQADLHAYGNDTYVYSDFDKIQVVRGAEKTVIRPVADAHTYQWATLSADGTTVAFTEPFKGVYVCRADGSGLTKVLDRGDYISWAGPETIIAVVSHDDGYVILDSSIVAVNTVTGEQRTVTPADIKVSEATAIADGTVVFSDLDGNMYTLNINAL